MAKKNDIPTTDPEQIEQLIERLKQTNLEPRDMQLLERLLRTFLSLVSLLQHKNASIRNLKRMIFGPKTDQRRPTGKKGDEQADGSTSGSEPTSPAPPSSENAASDAVADAPPQSEPRRKKPGHGRKKAEAYTGARVIRLSHTQLQAGDACPDPDCRGHLHRLKRSASKIHLTGQPIVAATKYEREVLRCSHCQDYFRAELPADVAEGKYDPTADVAIVQAKYGAGIPFYRLARLQESCGVPLPESVQFERCEAVAEAALPVYKHLLALAADGKLFHTDDTRVMILDCVREDKQSRDGEKRRATLTSGIVVKSELWVIALYLSGQRHAGENLDRVMEKRSEGLEAPIQMSDAQSANWSRKSETIESKCLAHGRRKFTEIEESFPVECDEVLKAIAKVYRIEAETKGMSDERRLKHHQEHSEPVMRELREWIEEQFEARKVEPNGALGKGLQYLRNHWAGLTRFLSVAGAPLDNNEVERALKRFVLFRKNSLFYKTRHGSGVGDILMSLIETCRLNGINAWEYLVTLTRNAARAKAAPAAFLPWNYARGEPAEAGEETEAA